MFGLPLSSFVIFILIPTIIVLVMFYYSWRIKTGRDD